MLAAQRDRFESLKNLAARPFVWLGVPPLAITLAAIPMCLLAGLAFKLHHPLVSLTLAVAASLTDFVDGAVARATARRSRLGDYLEAVVDRMVELLLLCQLSVVCGTSATVALAMSMLVSYTKPRLALVLAIDNRDWPGMMDHADRMVFIEVSWGLALIAPSLASVLLWVMAALAAIGTVQRLRYAATLLKETEPATSSSDRSPL
jgi:phosphatidylglycerophosphate synthase